MSDEPFVTQSDRNRAAGLIGRVRKHVAASFGMYLSLLVFFILLWLSTSSVCFVRATLGIPCPGCGLTRAMVAAAQGQMTQAFAYHPLFLLLLLGFIVWLVLRLYFPQALKKRLSLAVLIATGGLFFGVYLYRMLVFFPGQEPMTFNEASLLGRIWRLLFSFVSGFG